ncbi:MAG: hypothetical protein HYZ14_13210 [Bacteroidetes bacterium]|nr:hypothetical protein [Bacteroidota bacterium]
MNSAQEKIIHDLCANSLGAPYIFFPDKHRKPNGKELEPADLVWIAGNSIILFYMTGVQNDHSNKPSDIQDKKFEKKINHNLNQAEGWLKDWRKGAVLKGKNKYADFSLKIESIENIVILSIVDFGDKEGKYHSDWEASLQVALCATISESNFSEISKIQSSPLDLFNIVQNLKNEKNHFEYIKFYQERAINFALLEAKKVFPEIYPEQRLIAEVEIALKNARSLLNASIRTKEKDFPSARVLNDLYLEQYYMIIVMIAYQVASFNGDLRKWTVSVIDLNIYNFILSIGHIENLNNHASKLSNEIWTKLLYKMPEINYHHLTYVTNLETMLLLFVNEHKGMLQSELFFKGE